MAKKSVVATLAKRDKTRPLAYIDKQGNVRHFHRGQKKGSHKILAKSVVSKDLLKQRKARKVIFYVKGKKVMQVKSALSGRRKARKARKTSKARRSMKRRSRK